MYRPPVICSHFEKISEPMWLKDLDVNGAGEALSLRVEHLHVKHLSQTDRAHPAPGDVGRAIEEFSGSFVDIWYRLLCPPDCHRGNHSNVRSVGFGGGQVPLPEKSESRQNQIFQCLNSTQLPTGDTAPVVRLLFDGVGPTMPGPVRRPVDAEMPGCWTLDRR